MPFWHKVPGLSPFPLLLSCFRGRWEGGPAAAGRGHGRRGSWPSSRTSTGSSTPWSSTGANSGSRAPRGQARLRREFRPHRRARIARPGRSRANAGLRALATELGHFAGDFICLRTRPAVRGIVGIELITGSGFLSDSRAPPSRHNGARRPPPAFSTPVLPTAARRPIAGRPPETPSRGARGAGTWISTTWPSLRAPFPGTPVPASGCPPRARQPALPGIRP